MTRLNLGCGNNLLTGYVNIDLYDKAADMQCDLCELPFENESVSEIVCYQAIEHVPYNKSEDMFKEWYRVLQSGGMVIVETPDIDVVCRKILEEGLTEPMIYNLVGEYYRPWDKDRYDDWEMNAGSIHRNPWNFARIEAVAHYAGFKAAKRRTPDYYAEFEETLSVEITK